MRRSSTAAAEPIHRLYVFGRVAGVKIQDHMMAAEEREKTTGSARLPMMVAVLDVLLPAVCFQAVLTMTSRARPTAKRVRSSVRPARTTGLISVPGDSKNLAGVASTKACVRLDWSSRRLRAAAMNVENHLPSLRRSEGVFYNGEEVSHYAPSKRQGRQA